MNLGDFLILLVIFSGASIIFCVQEYINENKKVLRVSLIFSSIVFCSSFIFIWFLDGKAEGTLNEEVIAPRQTKTRTYVMIEPNFLTLADGALQIGWNTEVSNINSNGEAIDWPCERENNDPPTRAYLSQDALERDAYLQLTQTAMIHKQQLWLGLDSNSCHPAQKWHKIETLILVPAIEPEGVRRLHEFVHNRTT